MTPGLDIAAVRKDFPIYEHHASLGKPFVYLDSASSSQKPRAVIDAMTDYYETTHANVHRGVYGIAQEADARYEAARRRIARFINAPSENEVLFTKNVTESLNLVAGSWGRANLREAKNAAREVEDQQRWWQIGLLVMLGALAGEALLGRKTT